MAPREWDAMRIMSRAESIAAFVLLTLLTIPMNSRAAEATYAGGIGEIVEMRCLQCHRQGGVAPMSFMTFADLRRWSRESYTPLDALLKTRAMPPWPADPTVGSFSNAEFIPQSEIDLLLAWIEAGYPRGTGEYAAPEEQLGSWAIGEPDAVFELPEYTVPEVVAAEYKTFEIATDFPQDRFVAAAELRRGNDYAVYAVDAGPLAAFTPGHYSVAYPEGRARRLPKGATLSVSVRYRKDEGVVETDQSAIALRFVDEATVMEVAPMRAEPFTIPAGKAGFEVRSRYVFEADSEVVSLQPILRERGMSVRYQASFPDGSARTLLSIPAWNPMWQYTYWFATPIAVPKGTAITATAIFDNSEANLKNPDPWSDVSVGADGEIFEGRLGYTKR